MNSRAWTEVATGASARSTGRLLRKSAAPIILRRLLRKSAAPIILRHLVLLPLVATAALLFFHIFVPPRYEYGQWRSHCAFGCRPPRART